MNKLNHNILLTDLKEGHVFAYEAKIEVGTYKCNLFIDLPNDKEKTLYLMELFESIKSLLELINKKSNKIIDIMLRSDVINLAEDWVSGAEEIKENCYIMEDGSEVQLPILEEDFKNSLRYEGIVLNYTEDITAPEIQVNYICFPNYFCDHAIYMQIDSKANISYIGLN